MSLPELTLVPAGAGSGKTYRIQQQLGEWIEAGIVAPDRIAAVTFTEAAAAEMRDRIRRRLLELGRSEDALRLDQAYISTIHGFGLRVLTEFAFDAGQSPRPRLLNEDEQDILIRLALARTERGDPIMQDLSVFGYDFDHGRQQAGADKFRAHVLEVVGLLRSVGWRDDDATYSHQAKVWAAAHYGSVGDGKTVTGVLRDAVYNLLNEYPESLAQEFGNSKTAANEFRDDFRHLQSAAKDGELEWNWSLWQKLRGLRLSKRGCKLPERYEELASAVMAAADALTLHPGPLEHAQTHIDALLGVGQEVLMHYAKAKRDAGLVDYTDMVALAEQLLRERPGVLGQLASRIDCLVVDEFQDTNPLQFSLLWQLREVGVPMLIVGDLKQAIMGFQGADPRLLETLIEKHDDLADPLINNWRSQPPLMDFVNRIGSGFFGADYVALTPKAPESQLSPLEVIEFKDKIKRGNEAYVQAAYVGERIQSLLDDTDQTVIDRRTGKARAIEGRDIAVLCLTHKTLARYAQVLRAQGLQVRIEESGWFEDSAVQLAWYAISYVANPSDRHAALYLGVSWLGSLDLETAIKQLIQQRRIDEPLLAKLDGIAGDLEDRTVYAVVSDVFRELGLFEAISCWPDGIQSRANLLRLLGEAGEFMNANVEAKSSAGFFGAGLASFQAWLAAKLVDEKNNKQPAPRVQTQDAIELVTWHSAKGREWPVVVVGELERSISGRLPDLNIGYEGFDDLANLLDQAKIEFSPKFAAPEACDRFLGALQQKAELEARRLLYVALTRPREKLILACPTYVEDSDTVTYWSLLRSCTYLSIDGASITVGDTSMSVVYHLGADELPADLDIENPAIGAQLSAIGRAAIQKNEPQDGLTPDSISPSSFHGEEDKAVKPELLAYATGLSLVTSLSSTELGTVVHRFFEVLGVDSGFRERLATSLCSDDFSRESADALANQVEQFESWLSEHFEPRGLQRELPVLCTTELGSVMNGLIDLVIHTDEGAWIIDHKSDHIDDGQAAFGRYLPQLRTYVDGLQKLDINVLGVGVNWIRRGEVALMRL
jgi:ATP-dependent helicase/nuclease subunit A